MSKGFDSNIKVFLFFIQYCKPAQVQAGEGNMLKDGKTYNINSTIIFFLFFKIQKH